MKLPCGLCGYKNAPHFCPTCRVFLCRNCVTFFGKCKHCKTHVVQG
jgi:hypothetical protein